MSTNVDVVLPEIKGLETFFFFLKAREESAGEVCAAFMKARSVFIKSVYISCWFLFFSS